MSKSALILPPVRGVVSSFRTHLGTIANDLQSKSVLQGATDEQLFAMLANCSVNSKPVFTDYLGSLKEADWQNLYNVAPAELRHTMIG